MNQSQLKHILLTQIFKNSNYFVFLQPLKKYFLTKKNPRTGKFDDLKCSSCRESAVIHFSSFFYISIHQIINTIKLYNAITSTNLTNIPTIHFKDFYKNSLYKNHEAQSLAK